MNQVCHQSKRFLQYRCTRSNAIPKPFLVRLLTDFPTFEPARIRNFSIIAHVDHGKSTLADRLIEIGCGTTGLPQQLDNLQVERERGITVKAQSAALRYTHEGVEYLLNLIDTPGHTDFSHEVTRSLLISDGAVLLIDATQGVQAQTVSNFYTAFENNLTIIGAINKIDLPKADIVSCKEQMLTLFDLDETLVTTISSKTGENVTNILPEIIKHIPPPSADPQADFQALLHDCQHLPSHGAVMFTVFVKNGTISSKDTLCMLASSSSFEVREIGVFLPHMQKTNYLSAGQLGYFISKVKNIEDVIIGDTFHKRGKITPPLKSLDKPRPAVFAGVFPDEECDYRFLKSALEKLFRSDTSITIKPDSNETLGCGWRLGFLGTLHMEVFAQRLQQEYEASVVITQPTVTYRATLKNGTLVEFNNANEMPESCHVSCYEEPVVRTTLVVPAEHLSNIISYCMSCRGDQKEILSLDDHRFLLKYDIPLVETMIKFYSTIKRLSSGYVSCDFEDSCYWITDIAKVDVLMNSSKVEGLSSIVRTDDIREHSLNTVSHLAKIIPRQMIPVAIQCAVGGKITARDNVKPMRKDVTQNLYGGDESRAIKLLRAQSAGKRQLKAVVQVKIPREVFRMRL